MLLTRIKCVLLGVIISVSSVDLVSARLDVSPRGEVTTSGSFQQKVQLSVPTYHGLEPDVGLLYDSSFGNGKAGYGWTLLGTQVIERVSNRSGVPHMTESDQFSLNGSILIPCKQQRPLGISCASGGTHGAENETYQKIVKDDAGWTVWDRDGAQSRFTSNAPGGASGLRWTLDSRLDSRGNKLTYKYWCDGDEECYVIEIAYLDAKSVKQRTRIEYRWEERQDAQSYSLTRGTLVRVRYRLHSIIVRTNGRVRNALGIEYEQPSHRFSRIQKITRYGNDIEFDAFGRIKTGTHMPSERFAYDRGLASSVSERVMRHEPTSQNPSSSSWASWLSTSDVPWAPLNIAGWDEEPSGSQRWMTADLNGDGLDDIVAIVHEGAGVPGTVKIYTQLNRGDGTFRPAVSQAAPWTSYLQPAALDDETGQLTLQGDFNGDGLADLLGLWSAHPDKHVTGQLALGTGTGAFSFEPIFSPNVYPLLPFRWSKDHRWLVGDIDGDGRDDLIIIERVKPSGASLLAYSAPKIHTFRSTGSSLQLWGSSDARPWSFLAEDAPFWFSGDINGDGRADIIHIESISHEGSLRGTGALIDVAKSDGKGGFSFQSSSHVIPNWTTNNVLSRSGKTSIASELVQIGDFDGNGLSDIVVFTPTPPDLLTMDHLHATIALAQAGEGFEFIEQELSLVPNRQNAFSGISDAFPNRWLATDIDRDGLTDLLVVTPKHPLLAPSWPQATLVITLRSKGDGTFEDSGALGASTLSIPFDCFNRANDTTCSGGPMFDVFPAELNGDGQGDLLFVGFDQERVAGRHVMLRGQLSPKIHRPDLGWISADISGDGRLDHVQILPQGFEVEVRSSISSSDAVGPPMEVAQTISSVGRVGLDPSHWMLADVGSPTSSTADGKVDIVYIGSDVSAYGPIPTDSVVLLSNGNGTFTARTSRITSASPTEASRLWRMGDFNGDGCADFARLTRRSDGVLVELALSRGDGTWNYVFKPITGIPLGMVVTGLQVGDFDGNGLSDLLFMDRFVHDTDGIRDRVVVLRTLSVSEFDVLIWENPSTSIPPTSWHVNETNGDGKDDLVSVVENEAGTVVYSLISTAGGASWEGFTSVPEPMFGSNQKSLRFFDLNHDGCADIIWLSTFYSVHTKAYGLLSKCDGQYDSWQTKSDLVERWSTKWRVADLAGDGRGTIFSIRSHPTGEIAIAGIAPGLARSVMIGSENGIGLSVLISYKTLAGELAETPFGVSGQLVVNELDTRIFPPQSGSGPRSQYSYKAARWSQRTRAFLGFQSIAVTEGKTTTTTSYLQTDGCAKQSASITISNPQGIFWVDHNGYVDSSVQPISGRTPPWICQLDQTWRETCELGTTCRISSFEKRSKYDPYGNVTEVIGQGDPAVASDDRTTRTTYFPNVAGYLVGYTAEREVLDHLGNRVTHVQMLYDNAARYDKPPSAGLITRTDSWDSVSGKYLNAFASYDAVGNKTSSTDPAGKKSTTTWDVTFSRFPIEQCNQVWCVRTEWDSVLGVPEKEVDGNKQSTTHKHDALRRHMRTDFPDGGCLLHHYQDWGVQFMVAQRTIESRCVLSSTPDGGVASLQQTTFFDGSQRVWREERSGGYEKVRAYDRWAGLVKEESLWRTIGGANVVVKFIYDDAERLSYTIFPDREIRSKSYHVGKSVELSPAGGKKEIETDGWGRISSVSEDVEVNNKRIGAKTFYEYDVLDRLTKVIDAAQRETTWSISSLGWVTRECDPDRGCRDRIFDSAGVIKSETNSSGERVEYDLDKLGRVKERRAYNNAGLLGETATWEYDKLTGPTLVANPNTVGRIARTSTSSGNVETRVYDSMGRTTMRRSCVLKKSCVYLLEEWDRAGRLAQLTYPDSRGALSSQSEKVPYEYDSSGRVNRVGKYIKNISYAPDDLIENVYYGNGVLQSWTYDPRRRWIDKLEIIGPQGNFKNSTGQAIYWSWENIFDTDARLKHVTSIGNFPASQTFTYDPSGRLIEVSGFHKDSFSYDVLGNITFRQSIGTYLYQDKAHPNAATTVGTHSYIYDKGGRLISRDGASVHWDPLDRLVGIDTSLGKTRITHTADGDLASKDSFGALRVFHGQMIEGVAGIGVNALTKNYLLNGQIFAQRMPQGDVRFLCRDRLGSVVEIIDEVGTSLGSIEYTVWGASRISSGLSIEYRFAGGREDSESHLILLGPRAIDPLLTRFISPDSSIPNLYKPIYLNRYIYARNSPVNVTDPSGFAPSDEKSLLEKTIDRLKKILEPVKKWSLSPKEERKVASDPVDAASASRTSGPHSASHDDQVVTRILQYRAASRSDFEAWDRAREDYRLVRLKNGDPVLRDTEHFLLRYWLASKAGETEWIPRNLTSVAEPSDKWYDLSVPMNSFFMENIHDFYYNPLRQNVLEKVFSISPSTPSMIQWEQRGYQYGYCSAGRCDLPARLHTGGIMQLDALY